MKTVIFILALTAIAAPVFTAPGDAAACGASPPTGCNTCIEGTLTACFDCKAGYYLSYTSGTTGTCTRCGTGKGAAAGTAVAGTTAAAARPATATACTADCDATCAECLAPATAASCTRCAIGKFAPNAPANGVATCSSSCAAGKTRDVATTDITAAEVEATVCVACNGACAECMGTAATKCTKCAAGYFLSAKAAAGDTFGTCAWCTGGMGKDADTTAVAAATTATTSAVACTTKCTGTDCGACSAAKPAECLACATDFTFDATAKTCKKAGSNPAASSATLIQALCGASVAAYALF